MPRLSRLALLPLVIALAFVAAERADAQLAAESGLFASAGLYGAYLGWTTHAVWNPGLLRAGLRLSVYTGTTQFPLHAVPFARGQLGWFYLQAGWDLPLRGSPDGYQPLSDGIHAAAGIAPGVLPLGAGRLGIEVGLEYLYKIPTVAPPTDQLLSGWGIGGWVADVLFYPLAYGSLRLGAFYTFPLN